MFMAIHPLRCHSTPDRAAFSHMADVLFGFLPHSLENQSLSVVDVAILD